MKKLLTVLLAIAVVFTFSFGSTVAFAADDTYSYEEWNTALRAEKEAQLGYLATYKNEALAKYDFNDEGFVKATDFTAQDDEKVAGYTKVALAAAADAVIEDLGVAMDKNISAFLNDEANYKTVKPTASAVTNAVKGSTVTVADASDMKDAIEDYTDDLNKAQAPETEKIVTAKADAVKIEDYNSKDKAYTYTAPTGSDVIGTIAKGSALTAADAVTALLDDLRDAIKDGKKEDTDAEKIAAYEKAYADFKTQFDTIDTQADEDFKDITSDTNIAAAVDKYAAYGYDLASTLIENKYKDGTSLKNKADWTTEVTNALKEFWDANSNNSKDGKLFGIAVSDYTQITRADATSIYNAMKDEITKSKTVVTGWANHDDKKATDIAALYADALTFYATLDGAMDAADKYADVVKEGNKLKAEYRSGVKQYVDSKVDEAVKKAEEFVYGDLDNSATPKYGTPQSYIVAAANDINNNSDGLSNLMEDGAKHGYDNFKDAINDAAKKMYDAGIYYDQGSNNKEVTKKVVAGADKTAEEDLVYLKETYATSEADDWSDIAEDTVDALKDAQTKAEIESIMAKAAEDFGKLLKKADESDVDKAQTAYKDALEGFIKQTHGLLDSKGDYSDAYGATGSTLPADIKNDCPLYTKGAKLIDDATSVEAVKAAYADAQALVTGAKKNSELKDMKKAAEKKITALPGQSKLTAADLDAVKEAYAAVAEYVDLAGAGTQTNKLADTDLKDLADKYNIVISKFKDQIEDEAEALFDKMDEVDTRSDADLAKYTAYKAEAQALVDKVTALNDEIEDINDDEYLKTTSNTNELNEIQFSADTDYDKIDKALGLDIVNGEGKFYAYEIENAKRLLVEANKPNATAAQMKAALDAFNALTERQQLDLDQNNTYYYEIAKAIADKQGTTVKELKITASSTAKKGSITVKWTVKGSADIDGYEIWKSKKHSSGYSKAFTTTKQTYKNTKGLKKGTRYYYKVRAYKMVDGKKITSDWSNKARRIAK